jgi:site-specific recombinase XerD
MLRLVKEKDEDTKQPALKEYGAQAHQHHLTLLEDYLRSHQVRNHSPKTIANIRRRLIGWFNSHGTEHRPLYTWEAMEPMVGRKRILLYGKALLEAEVGNQTIRKYLNDLKNYFSYVLEHQVIFIGDEAKRINEVYHSIEQPISDYDTPQHSYDGEQRGVPLDPERLFEFYGFLQNKYMPSAKHQHLAARNYAMVVLAAESGLRADELIHLEINSDLFFDSKKLQTRFAKATNGSGKRARVTLFTPFARDTIRFYLKNHRSKIKNASSTDYLFISRTGEKLTYNSIQRFLADEMIPLAKKNGFSVMDHLSWHWFRRIFATRFIERFPDKLHVLIALLGHTTQTTVSRYIRHSSAHLDKQILEMLEGIQLNGNSMDS